MVTNAYFLTDKQRKRLPPMVLLGDLNGERPKGHPRLELGPKGKVLLAPRQVWVMRHNQELWVIRGCDDHLNKGRYEVHLSRYGSTHIERSISEANLRTNYSVWERMVEELGTIVRKVRGMIERGEGEPFGHTTGNISRVLEGFFEVDPVTGAKRTQGSQESRLRVVKQKR